LYTLQTDHTLTEHLLTAQAQPEIRVGRSSLRPEGPKAENRGGVFEEGRQAPSPLAREFGGVL